MDDLKIYAKTEKGNTGLLNVVKIFRNDICMENGLDKCAIMRMKRGVLQNGDSAELYDGSIPCHLTDTNILVSSKIQP